MCDLHASREYHKVAIALCECFVERISCSRESVSVQLRERERGTIQNNRLKLCSILETIILCGHQNIALRGHRDIGSDLVDIQAASTSHGNFWALLHFHISAGHIVLRDHLQSVVINAIYTSPDIQNQLIAMLWDHIQDTKVRSSYSLIADEVTHSSKKKKDAYIHIQ